jgi:four helix bundle protein
MSPAHRQDLIARALTFAHETQVICRQLLKQGPLEAHIAVQLFKAASAIGPNLEEGQVGQSRRDMGAKYAIALREAREARHWFKLLEKDETWRLPVRSLVVESEEFVAMLTVSVRKLRTPLG